MDLFEVIEKRRTIRIFKTKASEEQLREIILAGSKAPSAWNSQPWEFIIVEDQIIIDQLAEIKYEQNRTSFHPRPGEKGMEGVEQRALNQRKWFKNASIVAVCNKKGQARGRIGQLGAPWLCIENMSLAAVGLGLGSCIMTYWGKYIKEAEDLLGLPNGYELIAVMKFGEPGEEGYHGDEKPYVPRRPEFSWLHKDRFLKK